MKRQNYSQIKNHAKQDRKRREAYARQDKYDSLSLSEQLASCDPNGSKRQRARITKLMEGTTPTVTVTPTKAPKKVAYQKPKKS